MVEEDLFLSLVVPMLSLPKHASCSSHIDGFAFSVCVIFRDPIEWVKKQLIDNNLLSADDVKEIEKTIRNEVGRGG